MWGDVQTGTLNTYGHDTFAFRPNNGNDFVYDFHHGEDKIELGGFGFAPIPEKALAKLTAKGFDAILGTKGVSIEQTNADGDSTLDSVIHFGTNNSVTVYDVSLGAADFTFVV